MVQFIFLYKVFTETDENTTMFSILEIHIFCTASFYGGAFHDKSKMMNKFKIKNFQFSYGILSIIIILMRINKFLDKLK